MNMHVTPASNPIHTILRLVAEIQHDRTRLRCIDNVALKIKICGVGCEFLVLCASRRQRRHHRSGYQEKPEASHIRLHVFARA